MNTTRSLAIHVLRVPLAALAAWPSLASAQTTTTTTTTTAAGPTISASSEQVNAERFIGSQDLGQSTRPINLNPLGINYADCIQDMRLQFTVILSGFTGTDNMQIWATNTGDCTADNTRGLNGAAVPTCWKVSNGLTAPNAEANVSYQFTIPVRALVGPQNAIPPATTVVGDLGPDACTHQPSFAAVPITVWFLPVLSNGQLDTSGMAYQYPTISTDLVGPPAPTGVSIADGDTLFIVNWTPNLDADTAGYDVFIDPPPGSVVSDAASTGVSTAPVLYCPDAMVSSPVSDAASADESGAPESDMAEAGSGCFYINGGGALPTGANMSTTCTSTVLTSSIEQDAATTITTTTSDDEAGDEAGDDEAGITVSGIGGLTTIPCQYLRGTNCPTGQPAYLTNGETIASPTQGTYTVSGLTNGVTYNVVVAAVDGSGNPGPPSAEQCDSPAPVDDFWKIYNTDGGHAGGGFCALEVVGKPGGSWAVLSGIGLIAAATARRRRRIDIRR